MKYEPELIGGRLIRRYKRFLADVILDSGETVVAHCTNSGSMKSCLEDNARVFLSPVSDTKRKTRFTWEMIEINKGWVGINTILPNELVYNYMKQGVIPGLQGYSEIRREVKYKDSRLDIFASKPGEECFVEVKNVTLREENMALFPDAVTLRGQKHLKTLTKLREKGLRAVIVYVVQRMDVNSFAPAENIDPAYSETLRMAYKKGVEIFPLQVKVSPDGIKFHRILPFSIRKL